MTSAVASALPAPSADYIEGANGRWHTALGGTYLPEEVPTGAADVYCAVESEVESYVPGGSSGESDSDGSEATVFIDVDYERDRLRLGRPSGSPRRPPSAS